MVAAILIVCSLCCLLSLSTAVSLLPYGVLAGDEEFVPNDDDSVMFEFKFGFVFYNTTYNSFYVSKECL